MAIPLSAFQTAMRQKVFVDGEAQNHIVSHNDMVIESLVDLQLWCEPLKLNNTTIVPFCSTYFQCGQTVIDLPQGIIRRLSTYDKVDAMGAEATGSATNYCSEIVYNEVAYRSLVKYVDKSLAVLGYPQGYLGCGCNSLFPVLAPIVGNFKLFMCGKTPSTLYTQPPDTGLPTNLPLGMHVGQGITDSVSRAQHGVWAKHRGRIYIAPWIQQTETIVIEWDGLKQTWVGSDIVDNHPLIVKCVQSYMRWQHYHRYEDHPQKKVDFEAAYINDRADLCFRYKEETRRNFVTESFARGSNLQLNADGTVTSAT